jgi:hypothetical protein
MLMLMLAASGQPGVDHALWRSTAALRIQESATVPAESAGLAVFWPEVRFRHRKLDVTARTQLARRVLREDAAPTDL